MVKALRSRTVREDPLGSNAGEPIDDWVEDLGFSRPVPWCAVFASVKSREGRVREPEVWSARARDFAVPGRAHPLGDVVYGRYVPRPGDYRVKTRNGGNHVDIFLDWDAEAERGYVIGGNVGDRVQVRLLTLRRMLVDGTTHVTEVAGLHEHDARIEWSAEEASAARGLDES